MNEISLQDILDEVAPEFIEVHLADDPDDPQLPGLENFGLTMRIPDAHVREQIESKFFGVDPVQRKGKLHLEPKTDHLGYLRALAPYMVGWTGVREPFNPALLWTLCARFVPFAPALANGIKEAFSEAEKSQLKKAIDKKKSPGLPAGKTPDSPMSV